MEIKRVLPGVAGQGIVKEEVFTITLTSEEIEAAYREQQMNYYHMDAESQIKDFFFGESDDEPSDADISEVCQQYDFDYVAAMANDFAMDVALAFSESQDCNIDENTIYQEVIRKLVREDTRYQFKKPSITTTATPEDIADQMISDVISHGRARSDNYELLSLHSDDQILYVFAEDTRQNAVHPKYGYCVFVADSINDDYHTESFNELSRDTLISFLRDAMQATKDKAVQTGIASIDCDGTPQSDDSEEPVANKESSLALVVAPLDAVVDEMFSTLNGGVTLAQQLLLSLDARTLRVKLAYPRVYISDEINNIEYIDYLETLTKSAVLESFKAIVHTAKKTALENGIIDADCEEQHLAGSDDTEEER